MYSLFLFSEYLFILYRSNQGPFSNLNIWIFSLTLKIFILPTLYFVLIGYNGWYNPPPPAEKKGKKEMANEIFVINNHKIQKTKLHLDSKLFFV